MPDKRLLKRFILSLVFALGLIHIAGAQKSHFSLFKPKDTSLVMRKPHPYPDPHKAMLLSVAFPGLGQIYNKKYWKLPIIYAGLGVLTYFAIYDGEQYNIYHSALVKRDNGQIDQFNGIYTNDDLVSIYDYWNRYMWLSIIGGTFIYILNIVDANVDAQLHGFDVSNNLSFNVTPLFNTDYMTGRMSIQPGFSLVKRF